MIFRKQIAALLLAALAGTPSFPAAPHRNNVQARIAALEAQFPAVKRAHIGFKFVDIANNTVLAQRDAAAYFVPASNAKLYTTALALVRLGANYQFQTELRTSAAWSPGQTNLPDLQIVGGGDANLSGRALPYQVDTPPGDALAPLRDLAKKLSDAGIKTIDGDVTGVASRYPGDLYPDGWTIDDSVYEYGAPVSALTFNDNAMTVVLTPGDAGELPGLTTQPANVPLLFLNQVVTGPGNETHVHVSRTPGSNEVVLSGTIGMSAQPWQQELAVIDPAYWAASVLVDVLREQGITVRGEARSRYDALSNLGTLLATRQSPPLSEDIAVTNKVSQNLHAEMLLREVGFVSQGAGTLRAGLDERTKFLQELGITPETTGVALQDGSGLARQDLTTPDSTVALLREMWGRPERDVWLASLPIGGVDGSLEHRFKGIRNADRVHAKTGSLSHVNAMSGYIETREHGWLAFSIMVNGSVGHDAEVKTFIDRLCALFLSI